MKQLLAMFNTQFNFHRMMLNLKYYKTGKVVLISSDPKKTSSKNTRSSLFFANQTAEKLNH